MIETRTLASGLRIVVEPLPHTHSVSVGCFVGVGAAHESSSLAGIAHLIEHMLFKGSEGYATPKKLSDAIEGIGGLLDAYTSFESTVYYAKVADLHFERAVAVLADMLIRPRLFAADLEKERRVIIEELRQTEDTPSDLIHQLLDTHMWGDQPLGRDIAGSAETVMSIGHDALVESWRSYYTQANTVITVAGNVAADAAIIAIADAFAAMPPGAPMPYLPSTPPRPGPTVVLAKDDSEQVNFCLGFPGVALSDPARRALLVFDTIVGGGASSRLFQEIREERGLAYTIGSYSHEHHDAGKWTIYGSVDPAQLTACITTIMTELRSVREHGVTEAELAQVREQVKGGILLSLEDTWSVASRNGSHMLRYGHVIPLAQVVAEVESVALAEVGAAAQRVLTPEGMHLAAIGPFKKADERRLRELLVL